MRTADAVVIGSFKDMLYPNPRFPGMPVETIMIKIP
jgi:hypothetical protein